MTDKDDVLEALSVLQSTIERQQRELDTAGQHSKSRQLLSFAEEVETYAPLILGVEECGDLNDRAALNEAIAETERQVREKS